MSKTVDERVVSMQFDNAQFEKNVKVSMNTLDKLERSLQLDSAYRGLNRLQKSANSVDFSQIENTACKAGFSLQDVWLKVATVFEYQVARRIINSAKNIASAFTIDPVKTGFSEYETQLNAVQTILANTESKGTTLTQVNSALDELNAYADKTIYNFTEMTKNIGTFTAAGVELDTAVSAIKGIANLAAVSGSNSQQASTAMYQLSQALSSGTVKLMDWNSVVNAGMGGQVFQDALKETARVHNVAIDEMIEKEGSFRETLSNGWLTSEILTETLEKFTMATEDMTEAEIKANREKLRSKGYTDEQIDSIFKLGNTANNAATKVKTFTQLMETLKEAAQSGWAQSWEIIIGDFEEAKELWTSVSDVLGGFINKMSEARNKLLESALGKGFTDLMEKTSGVINKVSKPIENLKTSLDDLGTVVDEVIHGNFGNGEKRVKSLAEAGYNFFRVQNKVNETLGDSHRYTEQQIADQDKLLGRVAESTEKTEEKGEATKKLTDEQKNQLKLLASLTEEELRSKGYTEDQIETLRELGKQANKLGLEVDVFIDKMDEINGRWLLLEGVKNIGRALLKVLQAVGQAWQEVFKPITGDQLFNGLAAFHKFTSYLIMSEETFDKLKRTLKGVFAAIDILLSVPFNLIGTAFKIIGSVLANFGFAVDDILDFTAAIGDGIVAARDWLDAHNPIVKVIKWISHWLTVGIKAIGNWIEAIDLYGKVAKFIRDSAEAFRDWIKSLKESKNLPEDIINGLINGLMYGVSAVVSAIKYLATSLIEGFKNILGIHSPSRVFFAFGVFIILGLIKGLLSLDPDLEAAVGHVFIIIKDKLVAFFSYFPTFISDTFGVIKNAFMTVWGWIQSAWDWIVGKWNQYTAGAESDSPLDKLKAFGTNFSAEIDKMFADPKWKQIGTLALITGFLLLIKTFKEIGTILGDTISIVADLAEGFSGILLSLRKWVNSKAFSIIAFAVLQIAIAIAILAGAVALLTTVDQTKMWQAFGLVAALAGIIAAILGLLALLGKFRVDVVKSSAGLVGFSIAMLILLGCLKILNALVDEANTLESIKVLAVLGGILAVISFVSGFGTVAKKSSRIFGQLAFALLMMTLPILILGKMKKETLEQGTQVIYKLLGFMVALQLVSSLGTAASHATIKRTVFSGLALTILALAGAVYILGNMKQEVVDQGIENLKRIGILLTIFVGIVTIVTSIFHKGAVSLGSMFFGLGVGIFMIIAALKLLTSMIGGKTAEEIQASKEKLEQAALILVGFIILIGAFVGILAAFTKVGADIGKASKVMISIGITMLLLVASIALLQLISDGDVTNIIWFVVVLGGLLVALTFLCGQAKGMRKSLGSLIGVAVVLAVLIAGIVVLAKLCNTGELIPAVAALAVVLILITVMIGVLGKVAAEAIRNKDITNLANLSKILFAIAAIIAAVGITLWFAKDVNPGKAIVVFAGISAILGVIIGVIKSLSNTGANADKCVGPLIVMAVIIAELGAILFIADNMKDPWKALIVFAGIAAVIVAFIFIIKAMSADNAFANAKQLIGPLIVIAVIIGLLGGIIYLTGTLEDPWAALGVLGGVALVLAAISLMLVAMSKVGKIGWQAMVNLIPIALVIAGLGGLIWLLQDVDPWSALGTMGGISLVLAAISLMLIALSKSNNFSFKALANLAVIIAVVAGLAYIIYLTNDLDPWSALGVMGGISLVLAAMSLVLFVLSSINSISGMALIGLAAISAVVSLLAYIIYKTNDLDPGTAALILTEMAVFLGVMVGVLYLLAGVGTIAPSALIGAGVIALIVGVLGLIVEGLVALGAKVLGYLGEQLEKFGQNIANFSESVSNIPNDLSTKIEAFADAFKELAGACASAYWDNLLEKGSDQLPKFGAALKSFYDNVKDVQIAPVQTAVSAINAMKNLESLDVDKINTVIKGVNGFKSLADSMKGVDYSGLQALGSAVTPITAFGNINADMLSAVITQVGKLRDLIAGLNDIDYSGASSFETALITMAETSIQAFCDTFVNSVEKVMTAVNSMIISASMGLKDPYDAYYNAGAYLVSGFIAGIASKKAEAAAEARAVAAAALVAAQAELDEHSPSKEFYRIGAYAGEGLVLALGDYADKSYNAGAEVAHYAKDGLSDAISKVSDSIDSDMNTQPTIRPVLDLTDVEAGANNIGNLLNMSPSIGVSSNINSIKSSMNNRQNGASTDDVVAELRILSEALSGTSGNTYNINGITYDSGSEVALAIESLLRAAKMERRI